MYQIYYISMFLLTYCICPLSSVGHSAVRKVVIEGMACQLPSS